MNRRSELTSRLWHVLKAAGCRTDRRAVLDAGYHKEILILEDGGMLTFEPVSNSSGIGKVDAYLVVLTTEGSEFFHEESSADPAPIAP